MQISGPSALIAFAAALAYACLFTRLGRRRVSDRWRLRAIVGLVGIGFVAHLNVLRWEPGEGLAVEAPIPHIHEIYHYYLGTKYFDELGHRGLYEATVVADFEDTPEAFRPDGTIRNLETNRFEGSRADVLPRAEAIRASFSPERWQAFKRDLAVLRGWTKPDYWYESGFLVDHGYNGTPLLTAALGGLANSGVVSLEHFVGSLRWLDDYLLLLLAAVLIGVDRPLTGLGFLAFCFLNPLYEYGFVGQAYLRTDYLIPLVLGVLALRLGWAKSAGALLALSGWARIFPLALAGLVGLHDGLRRNAAERIKARAPFYASFAAATGLILVVTTLAISPGQSNPWVAFVDNMRVHSGELAANRIGVAQIVSYTGRDIGIGSGEALRDRRASELEAIENSGRRRGVTLASSALLALFALYVALRSPMALLPIPWMLGLFALQPLSHYYWAILAVVPVMAGSEARWHWLGGLTLAGLALIASPIVPSDAVELRFALYSVQVLAFLIAGAFLAMRIAEEDA
jgi:hypothetical protein